MGQKSRRSVAGKANFKLRLKDVDDSGNLCAKAAESESCEVLCHDIPQEYLTDDDVEVADEKDCSPEASKKQWDAFFTAKKSGLPEASEVSQRGQVYMGDSRTTLWRKKIDKAKAAEGGNTLSSFFPVLVRSESR